MLYKTKSFVVVIVYTLAIHLASASSPPLPSSDIPLDPREAVPCTVVIFGATGDLTARKLLPALYNLSRDGRLSPHTAVVGLARSPHSDASFRQSMREAVDRHTRTGKEDPAHWNAFAEHLFYQQADSDDDNAYQSLSARLERIDGGGGNRIYYLATPPSHFATIIGNLHAHGLVGVSSPLSKVVVEKPFGTDLASAVRLQEEIAQHLEPGQAYLIDHYLGKEGVQKLLALRIGNAPLASRWNRDHIDHVQITLGEEIGIGTHAQFWEETGSLRDVFQNHILQLLSLVAMEPPPSLDPAAIHAEKIKALNAIRPLSSDGIGSHLILGQYGHGRVNGIDVPGYHEEEGVSPSSASETYFALKLFIENVRWHGVPFYVRSGKRLCKQTTQAAVVFKSKEDEDPDVLYVRIQPHACILYAIDSELSVCPLNPCPVEAYERLLLDCIMGDHARYVDPEEHLAAWRFLTPVLEYLNASPGNKQNDMHSYEAGTWGPVAADRMLQEQGHRWLLMEK